MFTFVCYDIMLLNVKHLKMKRNIQFVRIAYIQQFNFNIETSVNSDTDSVSQWHLHCQHYATL